MHILLHTSKTMRHSRADERSLTVPVLFEKARSLGAHMATLSPEQLEQIMQISPALAMKTHGMYLAWNDPTSTASPAIESFIGDIYSGLQVPKWEARDFDYAQAHLSVLSGLYGVLRPLDGIRPYRLEMGCKLPGKRFGSLYAFWGSDIARQLPKRGPIVDLTAVEYNKTVTKYIDSTRFIRPKFLTISPKTGEPTFVTVHAKIARGAFAYWLIRERIEDPLLLPTFGDLGYVYSLELSAPGQPVYLCEVFGGLGLSIRLQK